MLRFISISTVVLALAMTSCATSRALPPVALDFFVPTTHENPWNHKIENWQNRHDDDPAVAGAKVEEPSGLAVQYDDFTLGLRRKVAEQTIAWVQERSRDHYRADGPTDHWATLGEVIETGGDDCDGLDLLTFVMLRRLGFARDEIYRSIVVERDSGQHHMVTLWFEAGRADDPYVLDPTGVVTSAMIRLSEVPGWDPIELFDEDAHYNVRPRRSKSTVAAAD